jgi:hypothetical protein
MSGLINSAGSKSGVIKDNIIVRQVINLAVATGHTGTTSNAGLYGGSFKPKGSSGVMVCNATHKLNYEATRGWNHNLYAYPYFYTGGSVSSGLYSGGTRVYDGGIFPMFPGGGDPNIRVVSPINFQFSFSGWSPSTDYDYVLYIVADSGNIICPHVHLQITELNKGS